MENCGYRRDERPPCIEVAGQSLAAAGDVDVRPRTVRAAGTGSAVDEQLDEYVGADAG